MIIVPANNANTSDRDPPRGSVLKREVERESESGGRKQLDRKQITLKNLISGK